MPTLLRISVALLLGAAATLSAAAKPPPPPSSPPMRASASTGKTLTVAVKVVPPFVIKKADGSYSGISVELWRRVAKNLGLKYRFEQTDLEGLLNGTRAKRFDVGVGAVTVTAKREREVDFSHPFYTTGLGIAVPQQHGMAWLAVAKNFFSWQFLSIVIVLALLLLLVGFIMWLFERKKNGEMFGGKASHGIGSSFWWAAVTMTTVGYGDKAPATLGGRIVGLIWMFAAIIIISTFTASIATSLTVGSLSGGIKGPNDLAGKHVAVIPDSTAADYLKGHNVSGPNYPDPAVGLKALSNHKVDAVVYDAPILRYYVHQRFSGSLTVLPKTFERQDLRLDHAA